MRRLWKPALFAGLALLVVLAWISTGCGSAFGGAAAGSRLARIEASPNFGGDVFVNPVPTLPGMRSGTRADAVTRFLHPGARREPGFEIPVVRPDPETLADGAALRVTWMGHSSVLVQIDGQRVLFDPVWSERVSPSSLVGPARFHPPPIPLGALPEIDAVVISHDHYDHLDEATIRGLARKTGVFVVPLGVGAHLEAWAVPPEKIRELDWWQQTQVGELVLTCTPARHFSGRGLTDRNKTLWASWSVRGPVHRVYFGGDTGMFPGFTEIGEREGPFDLTLMPIGAYDTAWADVHLNPEEAAAAHRMVRGKVMLPIHWGSFMLAMHGWEEPVERLLDAAAAEPVQLLLPRPGEPMHPDRLEPMRPWWRRPPDPTVAYDSPI